MEIINKNSIKHFLNIIKLYKFNLILGYFNLYFNEKLLKIIIIFSYTIHNISNVLIYIYIYIYIYI